MPRRTVWLVTGAALGAGSSLWAEHKVRRTLRRTAEAVQPDALVRQAGRAARDAAGAAGARVSGALEAGREAMHRREAELWAGLAAGGHVDGGAAGTVAGEAGATGAVAVEAGATAEQHVGQGSSAVGGDASGSDRRRVLRAARRGGRARRRRAGAPVAAH